jgi:hypothetical protein
MSNSYQEIDSCFLAAETSKSQPEITVHLCGKLWP